MLQHKQQQHHIRLLRQIQKESLSTSAKKSKKQFLMKYFLDTLAEDNEDDIKLKKTSSKLNKILSDEIKLYKTLAAQFVATPFNNYNALNFEKKINLYYQI